MLKEIATGDANQAKLIAKVEQELANFVPTYDPVKGSKFDDNFPTGKWVRVGRARTVSSIGETRCAVDPYTGIWLRYGGCSGFYNNECIGFDPASGQWFVVRPPENLGLFYNEKRANQGCSRGMTFDPKSRLFWINHAVGGSGFPRNRAMYPSQLACFYDVTLDRFTGNFPDKHPTQGHASPCGYASAGAHGMIFTEFMGPTTYVLDTTTTKLRKITFKGAPKLNRNYNHQPTGFDPVTGLFLCQVGGREYKKQPEIHGLWIFDIAKGAARKTKAPPLPHTHCWVGLLYDSLNREMFCFAHSGIFRFDREGEVWQLALTPKQRWADYPRRNTNDSVYVADFDPQHNVFLALDHGILVALRYKNVPRGRRVYYPKLFPTTSKQE